MRDSSELSTQTLEVDAIVEVLEAAPVTRGILFGSYSRGDDRSTSDVDIAIEFEDSLSSIERTRARMQIIEGVSTALGLDEVDVIPLSGASPSLRREIQEDGIVLYGPSTDLEPTNDGVAEPDRSETIERFDQILADIERVV